MQGRNLLAYLCVYGDAVLYFDKSISILDENHNPVKIDGIRALNIIESPDSTAADVILRKDVRDEPVFNHLTKLWLTEEDVCELKIDSIISEILDGKIEVHIPSWWVEVENASGRRKF